MMNEQELSSLWSNFERLTGKIADGSEAKETGLSNLLMALGDRLIMCPAEPRNDSPGCEPGGLLSQAIAVAKGMKKINDTFEMGASVSSILLVGLFHEIGKVGSVEESYFIDEDESWRREKLGSFYKPNEKLSRMTVPERSLYLLQYFGVPLSEEEFLAIRGPSKAPDWVENRLAPTAEPTLTILLRSSRDILIRKVAT